MKNTAQFNTLILPCKVQYIYYVILKVSSMTDITKEIVAMTTTLQDVGGDNREPGLVGGTSDRPGSAHDISETDNLPVSAETIL